jgi:predicted alpha/beta hydrolase family esterase
VQQDDWLWPRRGDWMARLEEAAGRRPPPLLVAAQPGLPPGGGLGRAFAAHRAGGRRPAGGAARLERADMPPQLQTWAPMHRQPLPFASTAVLSADDPFADAAHGLQLAAAWGSEIVSLGAAGHVNADSGLGDWPEGGQQRGGGQRAQGGSAGRVVEACGGVEAGHGFLRCGARHALVGTVLR